MNKRHYEHTLPNIRGSLSNTYRITRIVQVIGKNELSLYSYLDNVLEQHFATYQEEISELYKKRNSDIF